MTGILVGWVVETDETVTARTVVLRSKDGNRYARGYGSTPGDALKDACRKIEELDTRSSV